MCCILLSSPSFSLHVHVYMDDQEDDEVYSLHRLYRSIQIYTDLYRSIQRVAKWGGEYSFMHKFGLALMSHIFLAYFQQFLFIINSPIKTSNCLIFAPISYYSEKHLFQWGVKAGKRRGKYSSLATNPGGGVLPYAGNKSMCGPNLRTQIGYRI